MSRLTAQHLAARMENFAPFRVVEVMERAWEVQASGRSVVHLAVGEPDFGTPGPVVEAAGRAIADGRVHYTSSVGIPALREAISGYYGDRFGVDVPAGRIVVTAGASAALVLASGVTLDAGDEVILSDPGYPCNRNLIRLYGGDPVGAQVGPADNYQPSIDTVAPRWTDRTRGVLIGTPSNPTGTVIAADDLAGLVRWTAGRGALSFVDEVYGELVYDGDPSTALACSSDIFVINSFSKTFGMTAGGSAGWSAPTGPWKRPTDWRRTSTSHLRYRLSSAHWPRSHPRCGRSWSTGGGCSASAAICWSTACVGWASAYR